ncbi:PTS mannose transporter subunit IIA [Bacteroides sp. OttesenSCG-928-J23]|nr:PTS mannose transporter subunit IIA [Bacteroides sp. OttesenSCG-928-J23]
MKNRILVASHGRLAETLVESAALIVGTHNHVIAVGLMPGDDLEQYRQRLLDGVADTGEGGVLVLLDLLSGTPFNMTISLLRQPHVRFITGVNLPMLLEAIMLAPELELEELTRTVKESGAGGIKSNADIGGG